MPVITRAALFCGDRNWTDRHSIDFALRTLPKECAIISGGARGADSISADIARQLGNRTIVLEAPWEYYGKRAGPIRNQWMLDLLLMFRDQGAEVEALAFHDDISRSRGTADMLGRLRRANVKYQIITTKRP